MGKIAGFSCLQYLTQLKLYLLSAFLVAVYMYVVVAFCQSILVSAAEVVGSAFA